MAPPTMKLLLAAVLVAVADAVILSPAPAPSPATSAIPGTVILSPSPTNASAVAGTVAPSQAPANASTVSGTVVPSPAPANASGVAGTVVSSPAPANASAVAGTVVLSPAPAPAPATMAAVEVVARRCLDLVPKECANKPKFTPGDKSKATAERVRGLWQGCCESLISNNVEERCFCEVARAVKDKGFFKGLLKPAADSACGKLQVKGKSNCKA